MGDKIRVNIEEMKFASEVKKLSTREKQKVMGEEKGMPPRTFKGKPPKCLNCGVIGDSEK